MFSSEESSQPNDFRLSTFNESIIEKKQRDILVSGIDKYLNWRNNKNQIGGRYYKEGVFTGLRHYTAFGENRAKTLREALLDQEYNPIETLQSHFKKYSILNNHSLDTFLLESILKNRCLFLVPDSYKSLSTEEEREDLRTFMFQKCMQNEADTAFSIAELYLHSPIATHSEIEPLVLNLDEIGRSRSEYFSWQDDPPTIQKKQRALLIKAVKKYLSWRKNKDISDNRLYPPTIFSSLRHYSSFGKKRAKRLNNALLNSEYNPVQIVQFHFYSDSTLNNHSLDTYLLEMMFKHKALFNIPEDFSRLSTLEERQALRAFLVQEDISLETETEAELSTEKIFELNLEEACIFYTIALENKHKRAFRVLSNLAEEGHAPAQHALGLYYLKTKESNRGIKWIVLAAEAQYQEAIDYLFQTSFNDEQYLKIATLYETGGDGVKQNLSSATVFYKKAASLNNKKALLYLGKLYEQSSYSGSPGFEEDRLRSFHYYLKAAKQKDELAFHAVERIALMAEEKDLAFTVGQLLFDVFENPSNSLVWFRKSAKMDFKHCIKQLSELAKKSPFYFFILGKLYEEGMEPNHEQKVVDYYRLAIKADNSQALEALISLAISGSCEAQYHLSYFYHQKHNLEEAIKWSLYAAQQKHTGAINYLFQTEFGIQHYLLIANNYKTGTIVRKDFDCAIKFYEKAFALKSKEASIRLGQLYQSELRDDLKAFNYYMLAGMQKDNTALAAMAEIAETNDFLALKLAEVYLKVFTHALPALTCLKKLSDKKVEAGITKLETLAGKKTEHAYLVAQLYEESDEPEKALFYYLLGMQSDEGESLKEKKRYLVDYLDMHPLSTEELITIGMHYFEGKEKIQKNFKSAKICFRFASSKDSALADFYLGFMYQHGQGCQKKLVKALHYFHMAQDKDYFPAQEQITNLLHSEALKPDELVSLALSYEEGTSGLPKNETLAIALYHKAASHHPLAALHLGQFYQVDHDSMKKDLSLAFQAYLQAAKLGNKEALEPLEQIADEADSVEQLSLSTVYGRFFQNHEKASYWQNRARETEELSIKW